MSPRVGTREHATPAEDRTTTGTSRHGAERPPTDPLENLVNLTGLFLCCESNAYDDITPLAGMSSLQALDIGGHGLTDEDVWPVLANFPDLEALWAWGNAIEDASPLAGWVDLQLLDLDSNSIADVSFLGSLSLLETLYLGYNPISDTTPIETMTNLVDLSIPGLGLTEVDFLTEFTDLCCLRVDDNDLTSISALAANDGLGAGDRIDVQYNLLDLDDPAVASDVQTLLDRDVDLLYEEQR